MKALPSPRALPVRPPLRGFWKNLERRTGFGPLLLMHLAVLSVFFAPITVTSLVLCLCLYLIRMFGITAGYHRYFSHRTYKTSRWFQFVLGWLGCTAAQRGPLWWAAHHRAHHKHSDSEQDPHSPVVHGVWWSHVGWVISHDSENPDFNSVRDLSKYPEIRWLEKYYWLPPVWLAGVCYLIDGLSGLAWGFFFSTMLLYHGTFLVNSICHIFGKRRYPTSDDSRNNAVVALLTLGEGWHNNHHYYQNSANQGFFWWEVDLSYTTLRILGLFGIVWGLKKPPLDKLAAREARHAAQPS